MFIKIICIITLLEFSLSEYDAIYLPMDKDSKYGDDVCSYSENEKFYVKHCEKGKFCLDSSTIATIDYTRGDVEKRKNLEICEILPNVTGLYAYSEGSCTNDFECGENYKCIGNVCTYKCEANEFYYKAENGVGSSGCKDNSQKGSDGICYEITLKRDESPIIKYNSPKPNKICGKLTFLDDPRTGYKGIYYINKYEYVYNGEVEDGEYVTKKELCKSGFALYFFKDGKTEDPRDTSDTTEYNEMYLRCVTPISISKNSQGQCSINYKIGEDGDILRYNVNQLNSLTNNLPNTKFNTINAYCTLSDGTTDNIFIKLEHEKYREFYGNMTEEERKTCGDLDYTNKYTCENNELIKAWYFYKNPKEYSMYNERKKIGKVIDYYIQKKYPCYSLSKYLGINLIYLLILLLF